MGKQSGVVRPLALIKALPLMLYITKTRYQEDINSNNADYFCQCTDKGCH